MWYETVYADTGLLGFTTKHLYFPGTEKKFRARHDKVVDFEPFSDGFGLMRDAQTAKPQSFRTGDGWFAYNLAGNLPRCRIKAGPWLAEKSARASQENARRANTGSPFSFHRPANVR